MHTYQGERATFNYNPDFSGDVIVTVDGQELRIPAEDVLQFVAFCYVQRRLVIEIEGMEWEELLG
jgi:hypothetical protein